MRFTLAGGDVDFSDAELCDVAEMPDQEIIAHKTQQEAHFVQVYNTQYKRWQITIKDAEDTQSRLMQIFEEKDEMVFYPHFGYNSATNYNVVFEPDEIKKVYTFGRKQALVETTFTVLESSK